MQNHLEQGDVGETIKFFYDQSNSITPAKRSLLSVEEIDQFLEDLSKLSKFDEQTKHFKTIVHKCTSNDLKMIIRLIKHDLRMNAGAKHILEAVHPSAYETYQSCRDLSMVIKKYYKQKADISSKSTVNIMTPVLPMLAEACKSVDYAMKKCPNGIYSEIKYDGERVQVHKRELDFKYFSRSLKPVMQHKVSYFKEFIPKAFPHAKDLILDCEILMVDTITGKPLPFGTLGIHKKNEFKNSSVCLFVFDCIYYNGEVLISRPLRDRKSILKACMTEIPNKVMLSEMKEIHKPEDLTDMIAKVLKQGLEGLVLKDILGLYEPGKRHWLKIKKDYLFDGKMADSADLIVLGAWYGTGKKGGKMSVFLMGCFDPEKKKYCTVCKVHTGHDDKTLERLQTQLEMIKISGDRTRVPSWLICTKSMIPDFIAKDPKLQPVWEITGAEFTQHDVHTADGISIRFPRVTKIRNDKNWKSATSLPELHILFKNSKQNIDISLLTNAFNTSSTVDPNTSTKRKNTDQFRISKKLRSGAVLALNSIPIKRPLSNIFGGVKLLIAKNIEHVCTKWICYFRGFNGTIVNDVKSNEYTHVLHATSIDKCFPGPSHAFHVTLDWIKDSIKANRKLEEARYLVVALED